MILGVRSASGGDSGLLETDFKRDIKVGAILMCEESLSLTTERLMIALISKRYRE